MSRSSGSSGCSQCAGASAGAGRWRSTRRLPDARGSFYPAKEIIPHLFIGSEGDSRNAAFFKRHGIQLVVNCSKTIPFKAPADVRTYRVPIDDHPSENQTFLKYLPIVVLAIDDVLRYDQGVLVHCRAGMQRSAGVVAGYLMWKRGYTADQAFEYINKRKHETFWPRATFEPALRAWETQLRTSGRIK